MARKDNILDKNGEVIYPITLPECVVYPDGKTADDKFTELGSEVGKVETATSELGGLIETLIKQSVDEPVEQTIGTTPRTTANGEAIKSGLALIDKVKGNTFVRNQRVDIYKISKYYCDTTYDGDTIIVENTNTRTDTATGCRVRFNDSVFEVNHKYVVSADLYIEYGDSAFVGSINSWGNPRGSFSAKCEDLGVWKNVFVMFNFTENSNFSNLCCIGTLTPNAVFKAKNIQSIDLTQMFGAGNEPETIEEFKARLGIPADAEIPYIPYNEGELVSVNADALVSKGDGFEDSLPINIADIKDSDGNVLFPNGLCSAGDAHDEIDLESGKAIKRIGSVDLGTKIWTKSPQEAYRGIFMLSSSNPLNKKAGKSNLVCKEYVTAGEGWDLSAPDMSISGSNSTSYSGIVWVRNKSLSTEDEIKLALDGVILYYELAEPIVVDIPKSKYYYKVENGGTEQIEAQGNTAPMLADIAYRYSGAAAMLAELHNADNLL